MTSNLGTRTLLCFFIFCSSAVFAGSEPAANKDTDKSGITPDLRENKTRLKLQKGDFVMVPIPMSNPTLDTGLILGGAYFYPQSAEQKKVQPASVTAVAGMYTSNESKAFGIAQQNYWNQDRWRFSGVFAHADLKLTLLAPDDSGHGQNVDWAILGNFFQAYLSRDIIGNWYAGFGARVVDADQKIEINISGTSFLFDITAKTRSAGLGINIDYDHRDMPLNTYKGNLFQAKALFNSQALGSDKTYQSYSLAYRAYHELSFPLVLAWEAIGCQRSGTVPLWDACRVSLRGFPVTDFLGKFSASAQFEARWRMHKRWGMVGFAGGGYVGKSFSDVRDKELIPSYGIGLRFMVLPAKRINLRLDFARSVDSDAVYVSVGEAF